MAVWATAVSVISNLLEYKGSIVQQRIIKYNPVLQPWVLMFQKVIYFLCNNSSCISKC